MWHYAGRMHAATSIRSDFRSKFCWRNLSKNISRAWGWLHVLPRLAPVTFFPRLAPVTCFPAIGKVYMFLTRVPTGSLRCWRKIRGPLVDVFKMTEISSRLSDFFVCCRLSKMYILVRFPMPYPSQSCGMQGFCSFDKSLIESDPSWFRTEKSRDLLIL